MADTVDLIVDPAALVNHVLPYSQLFGPNALGTAELIRIALTTKLKPFTYVSTLGVGDQIEPSAFTEDADIRVISPTRVIGDSYANGYANSKWAGEVLLREANDLCGLPVAVFRCDMIMADTQYVGQLNVPDMFTRLMLSLVATGIAPGSFYEPDADGNRQRAHYDGLPVDFIAEAISTLGAQVVDGFETYHVVNPYDDGIGLDEYVDWLIDAGYSIQRIADYDAWLQRFETAMRALPERQRQHRYCRCCTTTNDPKSRSADPLARPTVPFRGAGRENRPGQRHPPCHAADHRQIHHRPAAARTAMRPTPSPATKTLIETQAMIMTSSFTETTSSTVDLGIADATGRASGRPTHTTEFVADAAGAPRPERSVEPFDPGGPETHVSGAELTARFERDAIPLRAPLYRRALGMTQNRVDAEDLLQDTMLSASSASGRFGRAPTSTRG